MNEEQEQVSRNHAQKLFGSLVQTRTASFSTPFVRSENRRVRVFCLKNVPACLPPQPFRKRTGPVDSTNALLQKKTIVKT